MTHLLLTGASGYVGQNFLDSYKKKYRVQTFSLQHESIENLDFSQIDVVLHCAALVHQKQTLSQEAYDRINTQYPYELALKAKRSGARQFVFVSSIAVYGESEALLTEDTPCIPLTAYGKSKLAAEQKLRSLEDENFTVSIIRPPMIYGKDAPGNIHTLVNLVRKAPILPFGGIENRRSFVFIENLIQMVETIIEKKASGIFLASDDTPLSTTTLIQMIADALGRKTILIRLPLFESFLKNIKPSLHQKLYTDLVIDNKKTLKALQFNNPVTPYDGIRKMLQDDYS